MIGKTYNHHFSLDARLVLECMYLVITTFFNPHHILIRKTIDFKTQKLLKRYFGGLKTANQYKNCPKIANQYTHPGPQR